MFSVMGLVKLVCFLGMFIFVGGVLVLSSIDSSVNILDQSEPKIIIKSPLNISYSSQNPILVDFIIIEPTLDRIWYSLNSSLDIIITGPFALNLSEGYYHLRVFANDSSGRESYSEVYFSINDSIPNCGDNLCGPLEDCSICSSDCGTCGPIFSGGGSGGSGGGGGESSGNSKNESSEDFECVPDWDCDDWELGENKLFLKRNCVDLNNCTIGSKNESKKYEWPSNQEEIVNLLEREKSWFDILVIIVFILILVIVIFTLTHLILALRARVSIKKTRLDLYKNSKLKKRKKT